MKEIMRKGILLSLLVAAVWLSGGSTVLMGHHSAAGFFETDKEITVKGTVKQVQLTNPHSWLEVMVKNEKGEEVQWSIEMQAPIQLLRQGWTRTTVKPGDEVTVVMNPMVKNQPGGLFIGITLPDGKQLGRMTRSSN